MVEVERICQWPYLEQLLLLVLKATGHSFHYHRSMFFKAFDFKIRPNKIISLFMKKKCNLNKFGQVRVKKIRNEPIFFSAQKLREIALIMNTYQ
jgi:hypothetical protein